MGERVEAEVKELEKLEQAAEETTAPEEIQRRAARPEATAPPKQSHLWFIPYVVLLAILGGAILLLDWQRSLFRPATAEKIYRYLLGGISITLLLAVARAIEVYAIGRLRNAVARFNLRRILRLVVAIVVIFILISVLFVNWYAAVVSLGL